MKTQKNESPTKPAKATECQAQLALPVPEEKLPEPPSVLPLYTEGELTCRLPEEPRVLLAEEAFNQLFGWACSTNLEICCLGGVRREGSIFTVDRFYLLEQASGSVSTELDDEALTNLISKLIQEGKRYDASKIKCWAHSHPRMELFWSKTDAETCRTLLSDYLVSIVVGQDFNARCRIDIGGPVPVTLDRVPVSLEFGLDKALLEKCRKELEEKLTPQVTRWDFGKHLCEPREPIELQFDEQDLSLDEWPDSYQGLYGDEWGWG